MGQGAEEDGAKIFTEEAGLDVIGDADDFVGDAAAGDLLAQKIFVAEKSVGENLIDDDDTRRGGGFVGEIATVDEADAEGVQIAGSGHVKFDAGSGVERLFAHGLVAITAMAAGKRKRVGDRCGGYAGEDGDAALEFGEELDGAFGGVAVQAGIDGHGENAAGAEANPDVGRGAKTAEAESSDAEKNERH